jgi:hypothetical protein
MKAVIYIARFPGEGFDEEVERAKAFCEANGLFPIRVFHSDFLQNKKAVEEFMAAARAGVFSVVLCASPENFPTRFLTQLVKAGVGVGSYVTPGRR